MRRRIPWPRGSILTGLAATALVALVADPGAAHAQDEARQTCGGTEPCMLSLPAAQATARYYVREPAAWDGETALPLIVWFHGYRGSGRNEIANDRLVQDWLDAGYLFVAGDGAHNTWSHQGSPSQARDDIGYVRAVLDDVAARYPIDPQQILAAGFSQGGSMVWSVACFIGAPFTHFAPVSGAFWEPMPAACETEGLVLRHTHGLSDGVVPMAGRPIGERWHQADVRAGMGVLSDANQCAGPAETTGAEIGPSQCTDWRDCESGALQLCLHDGGHSVPSGWSETTQAWVEETAPIPE